MIVDMAKPPKKPKPKPEEIETEPGAWERFEHAVDAAVKSGPKHREAHKPHDEIVGKNKRKSKRKLKSKPGSGMKQE
jgi:hypothetical protein